MQSGRIKYSNQKQIGDEAESDDEETKEEIARQAKKLFAEKQKRKENNPLDRFKPDDDFEENIKATTQSDDVDDSVDVSAKPEDQLTFSEWLWSATPPAPDVWRTNSNREILKWSKNALQNPFLKCFPIPCLKFLVSRKRSSYTGQFGELDANSKHGVGVYMWPEPPFGEGTCYYGCWKNDQMTGHGILTFFEGDIYLGTFEDSEYHGYGVYKYSDDGAWKGDIYEGRYYKGMRQGSGVYYYISNEAAGKQGAVYIGEWIRGTMQGLGILT